MIKCRPGQRLVARLIPQIFNIKRGNGQSRAYLSRIGTARPEKYGLQTGLPQPTCFRGTTRLSGRHRRFLRGDVAQALLHQPGFTLIELMVTLAVAGILLVVGVPSFKAFIDANKLSASVNGFTADLLLTRGEAIKRNHRVTLCASANGTSCATTGGWEQGRLIYADSNSNGALDSSDTIVRVGSGFDGSLTLRGSTREVARSITYVGSGNIPALTWDSTNGWPQIIACDDGSKAFNSAATKTKARVILLKKVGSVQTVKGDSGDLARLFRTQNQAGLRCRCSNSTGVR